MTIVDAEIDTGSPPSGTNPRQVALYGVLDT